MSDETKKNNGNIEKPNLPDQTRGLTPNSPPQKPVNPSKPSPTVKPKK